MATFTEQHILGSNPNFIKIVKMAILRGASVVAGEELPNKSDLYRSKRQALANQVMANVEQQSKAFALHIASTNSMDCTVKEKTGEIIYASDEAALDTFILSKLEDVWNDRAGITFEESQDITPE